MKSLFLILITFYSISAVSAATITSITSTTAGGAWDSTTTWEGGIVPDDGDDVVIHGNVYMYGMEPSIGNLLISTGSVLRSYNQNSHFIVNGDIKNYGHLGGTIMIDSQLKLYVYGNIQNYSDVVGATINAYGDIYSDIGATRRAPTKLRWSESGETGKYEFMTLGGEIEELSTTLKPLPQNYINNEQNVFWAVRGIDTDGTKTNYSYVRCINSASCADGKTRKNQSPPHIGSISTTQEKITLTNQSSIDISIGNVVDFDLDQVFTYYYSYDGEKYTEISASSGPNDGSYSFFLDFSEKNEGFHDIFVKINDGFDDSNIVSLTLEKDTLPKLSIGGNGETSCSRIDIVDLGNNYILRHYTYRDDITKNIGSTELVKDGIVIQRHDTAFYAYHGQPRFSRGQPCGYYSQIESVGDAGGNSFSIKYGYYYQGTKIHENVRIAVNLGIKEIYSITPKVSVFGYKTEHFLGSLELLGKNGEIFMSKPHYPDFWSSNNASIGGWVRGSNWYGSDGCTLGEITTTDETYNIEYICTVYGQSSGGSATGAPAKTIRTFTQVVSLNKDEYSLCGYDEQYCESVPIPAPVNLAQSYILPEVGDKREIDIGESLGKFQSGSGIILEAFLPDIETSDLSFKVDVLNLDTQLTKSYTGSITSSREGKITLINIPTGNYSWSAKLVNSGGIQSDSAQFGVNAVSEIDFSIDDRFEPYPHGYSFQNSSPSYNMLTGGIANKPNGTLWFNPVREDGTKWEIFDTMFRGWSETVSERVMVAGFESLGLNREEDIKIFDVGSCYGMVFTATLSKMKSNYLEQSSPRFYNQLDTTNIFASVPVPNTSNTADGTWDVFNDISRTILGYHLFQSTDLYDDIERNTFNSPVEILNEIEQNPGKNYMITFYGIKGGEKIGHAVVPYRVEGNKVYIWDPNVPYNNTNTAFEQYIEVDRENNTWIAEGYYANIAGINLDWSDFTDIYLTDMEYLEDILDQYVPLPRGFDDNDTLYTLSIDGDFIVKDLIGNKTGFIDGETYEEIPGSKIITQMSASLKDESTPSTWKQIYFPEKQENLTLEVIGKTDEVYDLLIAGGDYYMKLEGIETNSGQVDTFMASSNNVMIDFDDGKTGDYNLQIENFSESSTGSVYIADAQIIAEPQQFTIDWEKVVSDTDGAVIYETDTDMDGAYDTDIAVSSLSTGEKLVVQSEPENLLVTPTPQNGGGGGRGGGGRSQKSLAISNKKQEKIATDAATQTGSLATENDKNHTNDDGWNEQLDEKSKEQVLENIQKYLNILQEKNWKTDKKLHIHRKIIILLNNLIQEEFLRIDNNIHTRYNKLLFLRETLLQIDIENIN